MQPHPAARTYALACKTLKAEWYYTEPLFQAEASLLEETSRARRTLEALTPESLESLEERRSFWINVYNGAVIDTAIAHRAQRSIKEVRGFFRRRFLRLAGHQLSLDDIEHGLLRHNRRHPARLLPSLLLRPRLKAWIAHPFDPRLHFALNCGARSCPPIGVYTPEDINNQLTLAASAFLAAEVEVDPERGLLHANPILRWYQADFGGRQGLLNLLAQHRQEIDPQRSWQFNWTTYDWSI